MSAPKGYQSHNISKIVDRFLAGERTYHSMASNETVLVENPVSKLYY